MLIPPKTQVPLRWKNQRKSVTTGAIFVAMYQLIRYWCSASSPWKQRPATGHLRGIDFYTGAQLPWIVASGMRDFRRAHRRYPDIRHPKSYNEKIFWFKFFGEVRAGLAGNKLTRAELLPDHLAGRLQIPEIVWHAPDLSLPENTELEPGHYYFKVSHGCEMFKRVHYPLSAGERAKLQQLGKQWLASPYGLDNGEWWYHCFEPELLLEKDVCGIKESASWNCITIKGQLALVSLRIKSSKGAGIRIRLDPNFEPLNPLDAATAHIVAHLPSCKHDMKRFAIEIGQHIDGVRADFLAGSDNVPYLCELTFAPANALSRYNPNEEAQLNAALRGSPTAKGEGTRQGSTARAGR